MHVIVYIVSAGDALGFWICGCILESSRSQNCSKSAGRAPDAPVLTHSLSLASIHENVNIKLVDGVNKLPIYIHSNFAASLQQVED